LYFGGRLGNYISNTKSYFSYWVKTGFLLLFFALFLSQAQAQKAELYNIHFEIDDETSATAIHQIIQDKAGLVWLATDKGIVRFDGVGYKQYDLSHIAPSNEFFGVSEDTNGTFWFFAAERLLVSYDDRNDAFEPHPANEVLSATKHGVIQHVYWQGDSIILQCNDRHLFYVTQKNGNWSSIDRHIEKSNVCTFVAKDRYVEMQVAIDVDSIVYTFEDSFRLSAPSETHGVLLRRSIYIDEKGGLLAGNNHLFKVDRSGKLLGTFRYKMKQSPNGLFRDSSGNIWLGFYNQGAICVDSTLTKVDTVHFDHTVTSFFENEEGEIWSSTLSNGFFLLRKPKEEIVKHLYDPIDFVSELSGKLFFISYGGAISGFSGQGNDMTEFYNRNKKFYEVFRTWQAFIIPENGGEIISLEFEGQKFVKSLVLLNNKQLTSILTRVDGEILYMYGGFGGLKNHIRLEFPGDTFEIIWPAKLNQVKINTSNMVGDIFAASFYNIHVFYDHQKDELIPLDSNALISNLERIQFARFINENQVTITDYSGVFIWDKRYPTALDTIVYTPDVEVHSAKYYRDTMWVATSAGLGFVESKKRISFQYRITQNFKSINTNDFEFRYNKVFLATEFGLYSLPLNARIDKSTLMIYEVRTKNRSVLKGTNFISNDSADLQLSWSDFDYKNLLKKQYRWRLNQNDAWVTTYANTANLSSLNFGKYQFEVQQLNVDGNWSESAVQYFEVDRPYYLKLPFILLVSLLVLGLVTFGVYLRLRVVNERFRLKEGLFEAQSQALSAQLNPHFIFNSMNTVSSFIAQEDETKALRYISKLSVLLRRIFANSQLASISLSEELQSVKEYVEIEQLRFGKKLKFHFENKTEVDLDVIQTPAMLIQPFVENAIKHAVLKSENGGNIWLMVTETPKDICVIIEDDGPGFTEQDLLARADQGSSSISAIQKRLDIMKSMKQESATLTVEQGVKGAKIRLSLIKPNL
jgi:anti-sigma regulatory factor (Ser/Thr protein kinase)